MPTMKEIKAARLAFEALEPHDLFYRAATELVNLALRSATSLSVAEALAVLLQTWNKAYYRYHPFDAQHFNDIERLLTKYKQSLADFRKRSIDSFSDDDKADVEKIFKDFELVLGPVGAAKCLHLLAPRFFPLWDRAIALAYGAGFGNRGTNGCRYCSFLCIVKKQSAALGGERAIGRNPLKAIDEYNYITYTKKQK